MRQPSSTARKGPCSHCNTNKSIVWRGGPGNMVLCNACGSRWYRVGHLDGYIPKHRDRENKSAQIDRFNWLPTVQRKRRSPRWSLTRIGRLHQKLLKVLHEVQLEPDDDDQLIYNNNDEMVTPYETRLGAILLSGGKSQNLPIIRNLD